LSCAKIKTHGKPCVFQDAWQKEQKIVFSLGANSSPSVLMGGNGRLKKIVCHVFLEDKRQTQGFVVRRKKTHDKLFFTMCFSLPCTLYKTHGEEALCRASETKRTAKIITHVKLIFSHSDLA
jgi:hypothetical protein